MQNDNLFNFYNVHVFYDDARQGIVFLLKKSHSIFSKRQNPKG